MKKTFIVLNKDKPNIEKTAAKLEKKLSDFGFEIISTNKHLDFFSALKKSDFLIALGGDGTIIHYAKHCADINKPVLGINSGRLGFISKLEVSDLNLLEKLKKGAFDIDRRMMLNCRLIRKNGETTDFTALNDIVISKGAVSKIIDIELSCGGRQVTEFRGDGIILSTPTGSTAYALSAGSPIIAPKLECLIFTPICPHSLNSRGIIFDVNNMLEIKAKSASGSPSFLTVDGESAIPLEDDDRIVVEKSPKYAQLIDLKNKTFFDVLNEKMSDREKNNEN